MYMLGEIPG